MLTCSVVISQCDCNGKHHCSGLHIDCRNCAGWQSLLCLDVVQPKLWHYILFKLHPALTGELHASFRPISPRGRLPRSPPRRRVASPPRERQRRRTPTRRSPARRRTRSPAGKVSNSIVDVQQPYWQSSGQSAGHRHKSQCCCRGVFTCVSVLESIRMFAVIIMHPDTRMCSWLLCTLSLQYH